MTLNKLLGCLKRLFSLCWGREVQYYWDRGVDDVYACICFIERYISLTYLQPWAVRMIMLMVHKFVCICKQFLHTPLLYWVRYVSILLCFFIKKYSLSKSSTEISLAMLQSIWSQMGDEDSQCTFIGGNDTVGSQLEVGWGFLVYVRKWRRGGDCNGRPIEMNLEMATEDAGNWRLHSARRAGGKLMAASLESIYLVVVVSWFIWFVINFMRLASIACCTKHEHAK